jgi:hypothetical protein
MTTPIVEAIAARVHALEMENMPKNEAGYYELPMSGEELDLLKVHMRESLGVDSTEPIRFMGAECFAGHRMSLPSFSWSRMPKPPPLDANREGY